MSVGARLYNLRVYNKLSMAELGTKFGVARNTVYRWESGEFAPKRTKLVELAKFYDVSVDWILNGIIVEENELERKLNIPNRRTEDSDAEPEPTKNDEGCGTEDAETFGNVVVAIQRSSQPIDYNDKDHLLTLYTMLSTNRRGKLLGYLDALCSEELCTQRSV